MVDDTGSGVPGRRSYPRAILRYARPLQFGAVVNRAGTAFTILEFPDAADPDVVYLEHLTGSLFLENEEEIRRYTVVFDHLRAEALGTGQSVDLIGRMAADLA